MSRVAIVARKWRAEDVGISLQLHPILRESNSVVYIISPYYAGNLDKNEDSREERPMRFSKGVVHRVTAYVYLQARIAAKILMSRKEVDVLIFHVGGDLLLPMLTAKVLRKQIIILTSGSISAASRFSRQGFSHVLEAAEKINLLLCDNVVAYTDSCVGCFDLERYAGKIIISNPYFVDVDQFQVKIDFRLRPHAIGYLGRLTEEKGVFNLARSLTLVKNKADRPMTIIVGDGALREDLEAFLKKNGLEDSVSFLGWREHDDLPSILNSLRLLILPSYTEGLPNAILEAMACGTPVLATSVGGIPDVIKDKETGFIMKDNSPECIAESIVRALQDPHLEDISRNSRELVAREYSFQGAVKRWKKVQEAMSK